MHILKSEKKPWAHTVATFGSSAWRCEIQFTSIPLGLWPQLDVSFQTLYFCGMEINCHIGRKMVKKFISIFNETEVLESIWWRRNITPLNWVVVPFRLIFDSNSTFLTEWKITFHKIPTDSNKKVSKSVGHNRWIFTTFVRISLKLTLFGNYSLEQNHSREFYYYSNTVLLQ